MGIKQLFKKEKLPNGNNQDVHNQIVPDGNNFKDKTKVGPISSKELQNYQNINTTIKELQDGDLIQGTDGKWYPIKVLDIETKLLYELDTNKGKIRSSFDHDWVIYIKENNQQVYDRLMTQAIYDDKEKYIGVHIGTKNGPILKNIKKLDEQQCRCIQVESPDHLFLIQTDQNEDIFTANCSGRMVAGRLGQVASQMALGNSLATGIDGNHKGAGITSIDGKMSNVQYYYADTDWIDNWFIDRGFDKDGKLPGEDLENDEEIILEGEEEFSIRDNDDIYKFEEVEKKIINKKEQKFENV